MDMPRAGYAWIQVGFVSSADPEGTLTTELETVSVL